MTGTYVALQAKLSQQPRRWALTGAAGFIGSNLLEALLKLNQSVVALDNFATGFRHNLDLVQASVSPAQWARLHFIEGDICDPDATQAVCAGADYVLHQAALGSVPRSLQNPLVSHQANATGFLQMLISARDAGVQRFVYAGSSSTYGDHPALPKVEDVIGKPLSPYAVTKVLNELYASVFSRCYQLPTIGLRYFNVFGRRQNPNGAYAAVIPKWVAAMLDQAPITVNGDGLTSRDFCYVANVVQANLLAATVQEPGACDQIYNVAVGGRTTLLQLHKLLREILTTQGIDYAIAPKHADFRAGDVQHSLAAIDKARTLLGYAPAYTIRDGLEKMMPWYISQWKARSGQSATP
jgi:UDP-N-acetylglucosamine 4-epimerase